MNVFLYISRHHGTQDVEVEGIYKTLQLLLPPRKRIAELTKQNPKRIDQAPPPVESRNSSQIVNPESVNKRVGFSYLLHLMYFRQVTFCSSVLGTYM